MRTLLLLAAALLAGLSCSVPVASAQSLQSIAQSQYKALFEKLEAAEFVAQGAPAPKSIVYVFFDPNCPYCRHVWLALQHYEKVGLQTRWVPVGVLTPTSRGRAAAIIEAADKAAALHKNESEYRPGGGGGGIEPLANPKPETLAKLAANRELMRAFGFRGVPGLVWKGDDGEILGRHGVPKMQELPRITRLPEQWIDDPALDPYR